MNQYWLDDFIEVMKFFVKLVILAVFCAYCYLNNSENRITCL